MEFGQTPKQLFKTPHPQRFTSQHIPKIISATPALMPAEAHSIDAKDSVTKGVGGNSGEWSD